MGKPRIIGMTKPFVANNRNQKKFKKGKKR